MDKKIILTDEEIKKLEEIIADREELLETQITEDEMEGDDLASAKEDIVCLEIICEKLRK